MAKQNVQNSARRTGGISITFIGVVFLGICILVAGINIGGGIRKLNTTLEEKQLASSNSVNVPSEMSISEKKYLTEAEAGEYLNLSAEKIVELIKKGEITEYVETGSGYSISVQVLDNWFDNAAYQTKLRTNASAVGEGDSAE